MKKTTNNTFCYPESEPQLPQGCRITAARLVLLMEKAIASQKSDIALAVDAVTSGSCTDSDRRHLFCYIDSTALLLDACISIQNRLENIRHCLRSIQSVLCYLDGETDPNEATLRMVVAVLESADFDDKRNRAKLQKCMSNLRICGKKFNEHADGDISHKLSMSLSSSWATAFLGINVLGCAISCRRHGLHALKADQWGATVNEVSRKTKSQKRRTDAVAMEELIGTALAARTLLKLVSSWKKGSGNYMIKRMAVKAIAGELRRRTEELEKVLSPIEEKIGGLYWLIVSLRKSLFELISQTENDGEVVRIQDGESMNLVENLGMDSKSWAKVDLPGAARSKEKHQEKKRKGCMKETEIL
ncbi:hypothetical protein HPP92_009213 [Vanilla planifolia]|uniref:Uncharacterized protein n=1 Tax=Vanilla planifolia TaxID=51239 RepID=A0A835R654_VANPL|nr:hypothetical protein HPP92_009213 [Vanilla planifolia]